MSGGRRLVRAAGVALALSSSVAGPWSLAGPAAAAATQAATPPRPVGYVSDESNALRADTVAELERELADYEARSGHEIGVAIVRTTGGTAVEDYARAVFDDWQVGQAGADDGVLLLVAVDDRRLRLQTGAGTEARITPEVGQSIVDREIVPRLRDGDLDGGVRAGVIGVRRALGDDVTTTDQVARPEPATVRPPAFDAPVYDPAPRHLDPFRSDESPGSDLAPLVAVVVVVGFAIAAYQAISRGTRGSAVGFGGFGSDRCPSCGRTMSFRGRTVAGGRERVAEYACPHCGFEDRRVRGGAWGQASLFGSGWLDGRAGGHSDDRDDHRDDDRDDGFWGSSSSSSSSGSSGSSWSGSSGSGGSSGVGGGGSSGGGGASGSW